jgi:probable O-glycosylation ligase (exosortase A-associated)
MPKFTLFWITTYSLGTVAAFVNPLYGTLTYMFEYYLRPGLHWWGAPLPDLRWNFIIAAIATAAFFLRRNSLPKIVDAARGPGGILLVFAAWMIIMTPLAVSPERSWIKAEDFLKLILFQGIIVGTLRTERAFDLFVAVHMLGAGWWGWEVFNNASRSAGRLANIGSGDSIGDNAAAIHLLTVVPLILCYLVAHRDRRWKGMSLLVLPFVVNALILCNSRGATVALVCASVLGLVIAKSGHRLRAVFGGLVLAGMAYSLMDAEFIARQQTTVNYEEDMSATSRLESWRGGWNLIRDYPFGAGGFGYALLSPVYIPGIVDQLGELRAPHNTIVLVASEWGIPGLLIFLGYYASCARLLWQVRRTNREGGIWYYRSVAIQTAMVGVFIGGVFTDRLYAEAPYWMGGLAVALHRLNRERLTKTAEAPSAATEAVGAPRVLRPAVARVAAAHGSGA